MNDDLIQKKAKNLKMKNVLPIETKDNTAFVDNTDKLLETIITGYFDKKYRIDSKQKPLINRTPVGANDVKKIEFFTKNGEKKTFYIKIVDKIKGYNLTKTLNHKNIKDGKFNIDYIKTTDGKVIQITEEIKAKKQLFKDPDIYNDYHITTEEYLRDVSAKTDSKIYADILFYIMFCISDYKPSNYVGDIFFDPSIEAFCLQEMPLYNSLKYIDENKKNEIKQYFKQLYQELIKQPVTSENFLQFCLFHKNNLNSLIWTHNNDPFKYPGFDEIMKILEFSKEEKQEMESCLNKKKQEAICFLYMFKKINIKNCSININSIINSKQKKSQSLLQRSLNFLKDEKNIDRALSTTNEDITFMLCKDYYKEDIDNNYGEIEINRIFLDIYIKPWIKLLFNDFKNKIRTNEIGIKCQCYGNAKTTDNIKKTTYQIKRDIKNQNMTRIINFFSLLNKHSDDPIFLANIYNSTYSTKVDNFFFKTDHYDKVPFIEIIRNGILDIIRNNLRENNGEYILKFLSTLKVYKAYNNKANNNEESLIEYISPLFEVIEKLKLDDQNIRKYLNVEKLKKNIDKHLKEKYESNEIGDIKLLIFNKIYNKKNEFYNIFSKLLNIVNKPKPKDILDSINMFVNNTSKLSNKLSSTTDKNNYNKIKYELKTRENNLYNFINHKKKMNKYKNISSKYKKIHLINKKKNIFSVKKNNMDGYVLPSNIRDKINVLNKYLKNKEIINKMSYEEDKYNKKMWYGYSHLLKLKNKRNNKNNNKCKLLP